MVINTAVSYKSERMPNPGPGGSPVKDVRPPLGSQLCRPDIGPGFGRGLPFFMASTSFTTDSSVRSSYKIRSE